MWILIFEIIRIVENFDKNWKSLLFKDEAVYILSA